MSVVDEPPSGDHRLLAWMLGEAVSGARSYEELASCMKDLATRLGAMGVACSLLDEDGEGMIVYGAKGVSLSLYGYWSDDGATSAVVFNGQLMADVESQ